MTTELDNVLSREVALQFGCELAAFAGRRPETMDPALLESLGRIAFRMSMELAEQEGLIPYGPRP